MTYKEVLDKARNNMGALCKSCYICDGKACKNTIPGPGAKGIGDVAIRNYDMWQKIRVNMDTITEKREVNTKTNILGIDMDIPVFAGPVGAVAMHYGDMYNDAEYNDILVSACKNAGIAAFTGDGMDSSVMVAATNAIKAADGKGVPTVKPWNLDMIREKMALVKESQALAVAMDVDAAGLPFLKNFNPPAGSKSTEELKEIVGMIDIPFIVKGVMTVNSAKKAVQAGAKAIIVSNHGGRVLDQTLSTAEVLEDIVKAVGDEVTVLVDGGIRNGTDVFKALSLGAKGVVIARPFVNAVYGGQEEGVKILVDKIKAELIDTMSMCGAYSIDEISRDMTTNTI